MRHPLAAAVLLMALGLAQPQCFSEQDDFSVKYNTDISGITDFGFELYRQLAPADSPKNFFFSPFSIWMALTLTYLGTGGESEAQLKRALRLDGKEATLKLWRALEDMYKMRQAGTTAYTFTSANRLYFDSLMPIRACMLDMLSNEVEKISFTDTIGAAAKINNFASESTNGKINQVVTPRDMSGVVMAVVNAAYFKSTWQDQFDITETTQEPFFATPERSQVVPMMRQSSNFNYGEFHNEIGASVLELPYKDRLMSMFLFLPTQEGPQGFVNMVKRLSGNNLRAATLKDNLKPRMVDVRLPKFRLDLEVEGLIPALMEIGINDIFHFDRANLTVFGLHNAKIGKVIHKAFVEVDEKGTEASAVTVVLAPVRSFVNPIKFYCNRPFLFLIRDNQTRSILFMGVYKDPPTAF